MFFDSYSISASKLTATIFLKGLKASPAVLLIHGFGGTPYEMSWLAKQLNDAGYNVLIPRLAGHGTCKRDFLASTWQDWLRSAWERYIDLSAEYGTVYVAGHSMGALIATILAKYFDVQKLLFLAPAFKVRERGIPLCLTPIVKYFIKELKKNDGIFFKDDEFNKVTEDYRNTHYISKYADFYHLKKMAIKALPDVRSRVLSVFSKRDNIVLPECKELLEAKMRVKCEYLILERSGHLLQCDVEKEAVAENIIDFLKK